jgi:4-hydroxy-tetrahydrodipicolinate reductase
MKIAVIGAGKTGGEVVKLLSSEQVAGVYDDFNLPTVEKLKQADVVIIFAPGSAVAELMPVVLEAKILAVWGSTGFVWPDNLNEQLKKQSVKWIVASNFSLGMNLIQQCLKVLSKGSKLMDSPSYHIHEVHHIHKKDKPSGTALTWKKWLGVDCDITAEREGDINGIHELTLKSNFESITLKHEAHSRALFAQGALWAAKYLFTHSKLEDGLYQFADIVEEELGL